MSFWLSTDVYGLGLTLWIIEIDNASDTTKRTFSASSLSVTIDRRRRNDEWPHPLKKIPVERVWNWAVKLPHHQSGIHIHLVGKCHDARARRDRPQGRRAGTQYGLVP